MDEDEDIAEGEDKTKAEGQWTVVVRNEQKKKSIKSIKASCKCNCGKEKFPGNEMCSECYKKQFVMCSSCYNKVPKSVIPVGKDGKKIKPKCRGCLYGCK